MDNRREGEEEKLGKQRKKKRRNEEEKKTLDETNCLHYTAQVCMPTANAIFSWVGGRVSGCARVLGGFGGLSGSTMRPPQQRDVLLLFGIKYQKAYIISNNDFGANTVKNCKLLFLMHLLLYLCYA